MSDRALAVLAALEPALMREERVSSWPGSQLLSGTSTRLTYVVSDKSVGVLRDSAASFFDWVCPYLPGDLHFLRANGSTVLGTIGQEDDLWVELDDDEAASWRRSGLPLSLEG